LKGLIGKRSSLEDKMNDILGKDFESEKRFLEQITSSSKKRQKDLQAQIKSLRNITSIYDAKKAKISEAKKRELALRDQLKALSKKAGAWG
jgi:polyhydroxyalkanoate synthesis regulator phasin